MITIDDYDMPITVAEKLISARTRRKACQLDKIFQKAFTGKEMDEVECDTFSDDDLREIAEHLLVYVKHEEGGDDS